MSSPATFGPLFWDLFSDVAYRFDAVDHPSMQLQDDVYYFFYAMQILLPCHKCRFSYITYFKQLDLTHAIEAQAVTKFVYDLHTLVNTVSKRCDNSRTEEDFRRQLAVYRSMSSADHVIDILSIIAINIAYLPTITEPALSIRLQAYRTLLQALPSLLDLLHGTGFGALSTCIRNTRVSDLSHLLSTVYILEQRYAGTVSRECQPFRAHWHRYRLILNAEHVRGHPLTKHL